MTTGLRRSKAMPTDGPTAKFLYTIIKQLDLKSIDWNLVAAQLEISNGHAARMRFSRFKQQMEGTTSTPRASRPKKSSNANKGDKGSASSKADFQKGTTAFSSSPQPIVKQEPGVLPHDPANDYIKPDPYMQKSSDLADIPHATTSQMMPAHTVPSGMPYPSLTVAPGDLMYSPVPSMASSMSTSYGLPHVWGGVKIEPQDAILNDGMVKMEMPQGP